MNGGKKIANEALAEAEGLRETVQSLRKIAHGLPALLSHEVLRLAQRIEEEADELEKKLQVQP